MAKFTIRVETESPHGSTKTEVRTQDSAKAKEHLQTLIKDVNLEECDFVSVSIVKQ